MSMFKNDVNEDPMDYLNETIHKDNSEPRIEPHLDITTVGKVDYYHRLTQGSDEWHDLRRGILTASTMKLALSEKTLKIASNDKIRQQIFQLAAERVGAPDGDNFTSYAMDRGNYEETLARIEYTRLYEPVQECGFIINKSLESGIVGCSPDGLVGDDGMIEVKSRAAKYQVQTIVEHMAREGDTPIPSEFMLQVQSGLFVTGRKWCDFISYSNGLNMAPIRCVPLGQYQEAIEKAAVATEAAVKKVVEDYKLAVADIDNRITPVKFVDYAGEIK